MVLVLSTYAGTLNTQDFSPVSLTTTRNPCQITSDAIPMDQVANAGQYLYPHLPTDVHQSIVMVIDSG